MGFQDFIALGIAAGAAGYALRAMWRNINDGGCSSGACGSGGGCNDTRPPSQNGRPTPTGPVRKQIVTIGGLAPPPEKDATAPRDAD